MERALPIAVVIGALAAGAGAAYLAIEATSGRLGPDPAPAVAATSPPPVGAGAVAAPAPDDAPPARGGPARRIRTALPLPDASPWSLPPLVLLRSQERAAGGAPALRRRVLRSGELLLAPAARRAVEGGRVAPSALALLLARPRSSPGRLIVFGAGGRDLRVQETTLWLTRHTVRALTALPSANAPERVLFATPPGVQAPAPPRPTPGQIQTLIPIYKAAGYQYGIDWKILAAINTIETGLGTNLNVSSAGAVGWMQFMPGTWRMYGTDGNGDGVADPWDPHDAIYSAARYLDAAGASSDLRRAIWAYNHANWYVNDVLRIAAGIREPG